MLIFATFFFAMAVTLALQLVTIGNIANKLEIGGKAEAFQNLFLASQAPLMLIIAILFSAILFILFLLFVVTTNKCFSVSFMDKLREFEATNPNEESYDQAINLYKSIITDPETGAVIFKHFRTILDKEFIRASRYKLPFGLLRIAVQSKQNFDLAHKKASANIQTVLRNVDVVSINNEKEFICLLPNTRKANANLAVGRIMKRLQSVQEMTGERIPLAVGICAYPEDGSDVETLLAALDRNFQKALMMGENKVIF
jgi:diguanylate cyclase (GGDEF)-like protein